MAGRVLIVTPIASHPQRQGNSARIFALGRQLQAAGLLVHVLHYPLEGIAPGARHAMEVCWDHLHLLPPDLPNTAPTGDGHYRLDDWWDPRVADLARALHRRFRFCAVIANYVWFSAVLEAFGDDVLRVLDTHDVFSRRDQRFREAGLAPEWFYTSAAEEARGLARADIVLAMQGEEAAHFRQLGHPDVRVVGHLPGRRSRLVAPPEGRPLTVGYLASGNPLNLASFGRLRARLVAAGPVGPRRYLVAGSICDRFVGSTAPFESLGAVECPDDLYDQIDIVVNPMGPGTGLKIKSVEALFQGLPLVTTRSGMTGLPAEHAAHTLDSPEAVADYLLTTRFDRVALEALAAASRRSAWTYEATTRGSIQRLTALLSARAGCGARGRKQDLGAPVLPSISG